jgi:hypothetical protein
MAKTGKNQGQVNVRTLIEAAFPDNQAPGQLSAAIVSLVELCQIAMPDPAFVREQIIGAGFEIGVQERADEAAAMLALEDKVFAFPVRNLRHELFGRGRQGENVIILLSHGDSAEGKVVFLTTMFRGAMEADAVKAAAHVTGKQPLTGATLRNPAGNVLRRVFWDTEGEAGVRGLMVTGPHNVEATDLPRAFTAFNLAGKKQ